MQETRSGDAGKVGTRHRHKHIKDETSTRRGNEMYAQHENRPFDRRVEMDDHVESDSNTLYTPNFKFKVEFQPKLEHRPSQNQIQKDNFIITRITILSIQVISSFSLLFFFQLIRLLASLISSHLHLCAFYSYSAIPIHSYSYPYCHFEAVTLNARTTRETALSE